jgi:hypothetical protein
MGIFDGIGNAQYFEGGKYLTPGLYKAKIVKVKQAMTRNKRPFFVVELNIQESSSLKEHPIGSDASWMVMLDQDAALGNIKHFISVASETPIDQVQAADAEDACSEANPLADVEIRCSATNIKTKSSGYTKDFTKVKFMPASTSAADAAAAHAEEVKSSEPAAAPAAAAAPATA